MIKTKPRRRTKVIFEEGGRTFSWVFVFFVFFVVSVWGHMQLPWRTIGKPAG